VDEAIRIETTGGSKRFVFLPNSLVTLGWVDYPKNPVANSIDFVYMPADRWATPQVIGTDTDITDGVYMVNATGGYGKANGTGSSAASSQ